MATHRTSLYMLAAVGLFLVWSNSFIAASYLLGGESVPGRLDWIGLSVMRFVPIAPLCLAYCFWFERPTSLMLLRRHPFRLVMAGLLAAPGYNLALYFGQQNGVPPPIASLTTALLPVFVMVLGALFLNERLTVRKVTAFLVAVAGLVLIAQSKGGSNEISRYGQIISVTALAPLSWAVYSIISKPVMGVVSPLVWSYLTIGIGSLPLLAVAPWYGLPESMNLSSDGWIALLYLSVLCTLAGYAVWTWLLRHLAASALGFTVFLNPPLTTLSSAALALALPAYFVWRLVPLELAGGALALAGLAFALAPWRNRPIG